MAPEPKTSRLSTKKPPMPSDSLSSSQNSQNSQNSMTSPSLYSSVKKIRVFKNGDAYHQGIRAVVNGRQVHDLDVFLAGLGSRIQLPFGAKKLFTTNGKAIKNIAELEDGKDYVASSSFFVPINYGGVASGSTSRHRPSRSVEPAKKKKKKLVKKRVSASVVPVPPANEIVIPLNAELKKKKALTQPKLKKAVAGKEKDVKHVIVKAEKKKSEIVEAHKDRVILLPPSLPTPPKTAEIEKEIGKARHAEEEVRSVSRYDNRPSTRAVSRMTTRTISRGRKNESDESIEKKEMAENNGQHRRNNTHSVARSRSTSSHDSVESHIPSPKRKKETSSDESSDEEKEADDEDDDDDDESEKEEEIVKQEKNDTKLVKPAEKTDEKHKKQEPAAEPEKNLEKRKKSIYPNWGDLTSFTKNIDSLLRKNK